MQIPVKVRQPESDDERRKIVEVEVGATAAEEEIQADSATDWRDMALRLQAEMDNFRKRQQRLAQEQIASDRERLLRGVLPLADNLERALAHKDGQDGLRQGVVITHNALLQWLKQQGVERLDAAGKPFDPAWHDAISTVPASHYDAEPQTVAAVSEAGYRLHDRVLRPAKVIVAV